MKRWTRKLLAGLLSFGMLLQVASPLSALAAEDAPMAAHTLTVTVGSTEYTLTSDGTGVTKPANWPSNYPAVSYDDGFVFSGKFDNTDLLSISGSENVTIRSTGTYTVKGDLTANVANLTVEKGSTTDPAIGGKADITCTGNVSISGNIDYSNIHLVNQSVGEKLTVESAQNVNIDGILNGGAEITCDTLKLNCGNGSTVRGELVVNNAREVTATAYALYGVIGDDGATGKLVLNNCTGTVKLVDKIQTYSGLIRNGSVTVTPSSNVIYYASTSAEGTGKARVMAEACKKPMYQYFEINLGGQTQPTTHTLTLTNAKAYDGQNELPGTAGENGTTTYTVENGKELKIKAVAPSEGQWKFDGWDGSNENSGEITVIVTGNMTLTANWVVETPEPDKGEEVEYGITVTIGNGDPIEVTSNNCGNILGDTYTNGELTYDPESHTLTGTGTFGKLKINITAADSVDVKLSNDAGGIVVDGSLTVDGAQNVTVVSKNAAESDSFGTVVCGDVTINCTGNILLENEGTGDVIGGSGASRTLKVEKAHDVTIRGVCNASESAKATYTIYGSAEIDCTGDVEITSDAYIAVKEKLTVDGAQNVTVSGNQDNRAAIGGAAEITCSGAVTLENKGSGKAVSGELKYTPTHTQKYEIKTGAAAASAETFYTGESGTGYTGAFDNSYINIAPASSGDTTPDDTGTVDSASDAGGAVAAVLVGGAAVWGGYEIATRVILHNILPEGTAIPANRGQLALLVWNNAGRPEPVNEPVFADIDDADMAKAAQWCVEQGIMEAKTAETFKPEGWMPKFKVIEVWNKAFPKQ